MLKNNGNRGFLKFGILTIVAVYILIFVGGLVRSTGSGMGCPDWPKCFGQWVPPTEISQLPDNYKEIYLNKRLAKNQKVAKMLKVAGFEETANKILNDPNIAKEADFNPVKTWIEYINRIVGVLVGFLILLVVVYAFPYLKSDPVVFWVSFFSFILVAFEGWLGSIVVSTNLMPFTVTLHMGLAIVIVLMLIYAIFRANRNNFSQYQVTDKGLIQLLLLLLIIVSFVQILVGTQVREEVDLVSAAYNFENRNIWIEELGRIFLGHKILGILVFVLHIIFFLFAVRKIQAKPLKNWTKGTVAVMAIALLSGIVLNSSFPALVQPLHLLTAVLLVGMQFVLFMMIKIAENKSNLSFKA